MKSTDLFKTLNKISRSSVSSHVTLESLLTYFEVMMVMVMMTMVGHMVVTYRDFDDDGDVDIVMIMVMVSCENQQLMMILIKSQDIYDLI